MNNLNPIGGCEGGYRETACRLPPTACFGSPTHRVPVPGEVTGSSATEAILDADHQREVGLVIERVGAEGKILDQVEAGRQPGGMKAFQPDAEGHAEQGFVDDVGLIVGEAEGDFADGELPVVKNGDSAKHVAISGEVDALWGGGKKK